MSTIGNRALAVLNRWTGADWLARWKVIARGSDVYRRDGETPAEFRERRVRAGHWPHIMLGMIGGWPAVYAVALAQRDDGDRSPEAVADQELDVEMTMRGAWAWTAIVGAALGFGGWIGLAALTAAAAALVVAVDRSFRAEGM